MKNLVFSIKDPLQGLSTLDHPIIDAHFHLWEPTAIDLFLEATSIYGVKGFLAITDPKSKSKVRNQLPSRTTVFAFYLSSKAFAHHQVPELLADLQNAFNHNYKCVKMWFGPRFLDWAEVSRPFRLDAPELSPVWSKIEEYGFIVDIHIGDPDICYARDYQDPKYGTKKETLNQFKTILGDYPSINFIGVHMAGHPEHVTILSDLLNEFPNLAIDTASTRWIIRELGKEEQREATRDLMNRYSSRILFGSDLSVSGGRGSDYYLTRYWSQRIFWESSHVAPLPFEDKDNPSGTIIRGLSLPRGILKKFYWENAAKLFRFV